MPLPKKRNNKLNVLVGLCFFCYGMSILTLQSVINALLLGIIARLINMHTCDRGKKKPLEGPVVLTGNAKAKGLE